MPDWLAITQDWDQLITPRRKRWLQMVEDLDQEHGRRQTYTVPEAAAFWDKHPKTVRRWVREGKIASSNRGQRKTRISREQMLAKQWELHGELAFFSKLFSGLPENTKGTSQTDKGT
jgi:excisionase family DNA binding protein